MMYGHGLRGSSKSRIYDDITPHDVLPPELEIQVAVKGLSTTGKLFKLQKMLNACKIDVEASNYWVKFAFYDKQYMVEKLIKELQDGPVQTSDSYKPYIGRSRTIFSSGFEKAYSSVPSGWSNHIQPTDSLEYSPPSNVGREAQTRYPGRSSNPFSMV
jgi:hypothetical protein